MDEITIKRTSDIQEVERWIKDDLTLDIVEVKKWCNSIRHFDPTELQKTHAVLQQVSGKLKTSIVFLDLLSKVDTKLFLGTGKTMYTTLITFCNFDNLMVPTYFFQ